MLVRVQMLVTQSCPTLCNPMDCSLPGSSAHGDSPGKNTRVGCHTLLQGIFQTQGSNPSLLHCRWRLYCLSHQGSPRILEWVAIPSSRGSSRSRNQTCFSWSPALPGGFFTTEPQGKPIYACMYICTFLAVFHSLQELSSPTRD